MQNAAEPDRRAAIPYGYGKHVDAPVLDAVERVRACLQTEGFGVLSEISINEKLKEKLGVEFRDYVILGACNPPLAYKALQEELNIGLLLPCNVVVYADGGGSFVAAVDATTMLSVVGRPELATLAAEVDVRLRRAIDSL